MPAKRHVPLTERLTGKRVCVCVGAGGVGKTTVSAALGLALAKRGRKVVVVSIDPAKRLATALGLTDLPGEPHRIGPDALAAAGVDLGDGELWAMMLDSKATFDGLVRRLSQDERTRAEVYSNRIYRELSTATAGSQEFTAVAKLFDLHREGRFDVVVLDTPPSRNALDFLDAPRRLTGFLDGRALRLLSGGGGIARGVLGRGAGVAASMLARATGVNLIGELSAFFGALTGVIDGFSERARGVERLLRDPATGFVLISSPEHEPAREAEFFHRRLQDAGMPFTALVVNRVHEEGLGGRSPQRLAAQLSEQVGEELAQKLVGNLLDFDVLARRDRACIERLKQALSEEDPVVLGELDAGVQDLGGLHLLAERFLA